VAEGRSLAEVEVPAPRGHSVEVRLYAEDPARDYQPQSGRLSRFELPGVVAEFANPTTYGLRLDSGVGAGDEIGTFYDAMIAKVIAWAPTREEALRRLAGSLARAELHGLRTNRDLLVNLLRDPVVLDGTMHTTWLDGADLSALAASPGGPETVPLSGFAAAVVLAEQARLASPVHPRVPAGWRNVVAQPQLTTFGLGEEELEVRWFGGRAFSSADLPDVTVVSTSPTGVVLAVDGVARPFVVHVDGTRIDVESSLGHVALVRKPRFVDPADQVATGSLLAPMPGSVVSVSAAVGDVVSAGQVVLVLEAMKMQHVVAAPYAGTVTELPVTTGQQVTAGDVLAVVTPEETEGDDA
jgi:acyl-CoA carboxylase subunit alpha